MTKNNAFKKTIRAYMEDHDLSYTAARKILDEESYLQGTGSITLVVGAIASGKTTAFHELLSVSRLPTAVLIHFKEEIHHLKNNHFVDILKLHHLKNNSCVDALKRSKEQLQELAAEKKYSQFAIDDLGHLGERLYSNDGSEYFLDALPRRADLILTFYSSHSLEERETPVESILNRLDNMHLSSEKLSQRVTLIKHLTKWDNDWEIKNLSLSDRLHITNYHL